MYDPKYDLPLAVGLSLAVSLIATYDAAVGPFCPESIDTTAADSGIWLDGSGTVYDADGNFIVNLPEIYDDEHWQLYDQATGKVRVTDTQEACEAAARPDMDLA